MKAAVVDYDLGNLPSVTKAIRRIGWATLDVAPRAKVLDAVQTDDMAYFVHSYYVDPDPSVIAATTTYEHDFCSAIEMDNVVGVQFHPEKSAQVGRKMLQRFFDVVVSPASAEGRPSK